LEELSLRMAKEVACCQPVAEGEGEEAPSGLEAVEEVVP
jgi:hypothetical protein